MYTPHRFDPASASPSEMSARLAQSSGVVFGLGLVGMAWNALLYAVLAAVQTYIYQSLHLRRNNTLEHTKAVQSTDLPLCMSFES